jgi:hypothetical protein
VAYPAGHRCLSMMTHVSNAEFTFEYVFPSSEFASFVTEELSNHRQREVRLTQSLVLSLLRNGMRTLIHPVSSHAMSGDTSDDPIAVAMNV